MWLRDSFAVRRNLPSSTATLIHSPVKMRIELRIRPVAAFSKTRTRGRISHKMCLTILSEEDEKARADGPRFQVFVDLPEWLERLIEKLSRRLFGGA
jgi:hypothetical protein